MRVLRLKTIKMGGDYTADAMSFGLIAIVEAIMIIRKEYDPPHKYEYFYQRWAVINEAIIRSTKKTEIELDKERETQMICLLNDALRDHWSNHLRNGGKMENE